MKKICFILLMIGLTCQPLVSAKVHPQSRSKINYKSQTKYNFKKFKTLKRASSNSSGLDTSFGKNGVQINDFSKMFQSSGRDIINAISTQSNGQIIAGGTSTADQNFFNFALARFNTNGTLDTNFGVNGLVTTDIGAFTSEGPHSTYSFLNGLAIQTDGKIIGGGQVQVNEQILICLARYNTDGTLDTNFGPNKSGVVITDIGAILGLPGKDCAIDAIILQPDGKIVACGGFTLNVQGTLGLVRYNVDGTLDKNFGIKGVVVSPDFTLTNNANVLQLQNDGKIIICGVNNPSSAGIFAVTRYNSDGSIDNLFGTNGVVTTNFGPNCFATGVAIYANKIIAGGKSIVNNIVHYVLAKYNSDGSPDSSFGTGGTIDKILTPSQISIETITIQSDGKIVTVGNSITAGDTFFLTRLNIDGTFDTNFGTNGIAGEKFGIDFEGAINTPNSLLVQSDGKIFSGGVSDAIDFNNDFLLAKYNSNGSLDKTFGRNVSVFFVPGNNGVSDIDFKTVLKILSGASNCINAVATQSNGQIVVIGFSDGEDPNYDFSAYNYNPDGTVNANISFTTQDFSGYNNGDDTIYGTHDIATCVAMQKNDSYVIAGSSDTIGQFPSFALVRNLKDGSTDTSFGLAEHNNLVVTNFGQVQKKALTTDAINSILLQPDEKIVAGGSSAPDSLNITGSFALARYHNNGLLDNSFGNLNLGIVTTNIGKTLGSTESFDSIDSIALQTDGKIVAAGFSSYKNPLGNFALARYKPNGTLDGSFGNKGIVITNFNSNKINASQINKVVIQTDGKILVGGIATIDIPNFNPNNPRFNFALARYNSDGSLDQNFGTKGLVVTQLNPNGNNSTSNDYLSTLVITNDGTIIAGGTSNATDPNFDFALVVYDNNGAVNTSVGNNGIIFTDFKTVLGLGSGSQDSINQNGMTLQTDGKLLAAGSTNATNANFDFAIARYGISQSSCTNAKDVFTRALFEKYGQ